MIDVRGTQNDQSSTDPVEAYAEAPERKAGHARMAALVLLSLIVYVKSFFFRDDSQAESLRPPAEDENSSAKVLHPEWLDSAGNAEVPGNDVAPEQTDDTSLSAQEFASRPDTIAIFDVIDDGFPVLRPAGFVVGQANSNVAPAVAMPPPLRMMSAPETQGKPSFSNGNALVPLAPASDGSEGAAGDEKPEPDSSMRETDTGDVEGAQQSAKNRAPTVSGPVNLGDFSGCVPVAFLLADLLRHADDPDGDVLTVQGLEASAGELMQGQDGSWSLGHDTPGLIALTYQISDGEHAVAQTAHLSLLGNPPILGTATADILVGASCADIIEGRGGADIISAGAGPDVVHGGGGADHIVAGDGDDVVRGGAGADVLFGGAGNDYMFGGDGADRLFGGAGHDILDGGAGGDHLDGGAGDDLILGGRGDDTIIGGAGADRISGGEGADDLSGGAGRDMVSGDGGADIIRAAADAASDQFDGGDGNDTIDYSAAADTLQADLAKGEVQGISVGADTISGFETFISGSGDDVLHLGPDAGRVAGGPGNDQFALLSPVSGEADTFSFTILDFAIGDHIRISNYGFFDAEDAAPDAFERVYGESHEGEEGAIRYRNDWAEELDRTVIEADLDGDGTFEIVGAVEGRHHLHLYETA
ncbi:cadherin-like domain-containing protein [Sedimentitalea sp.]|uniref:calcium-binding protein n=1 Tax=Sedimentitalea sp. TaxID=2048915 RepID=UPI0032984718